MLTAHYAPRTPLELGQLDELLTAHANKRIAVLAFERARPAFACRTLSDSGDLAEAARALLAAWRELDACGADMTLAEPDADQLVRGRAVADRPNAPEFGLAMPRRSPTSRVPNSRVSAPVNGLISARW